MNSAGLTDEPPGAPAASLHCPAIIDGAAAGRTLGQTVVARAIEFGPQPYTEVTLRGEENEVAIATLLDRATQLLAPLLTPEVGDAKVVLCTESVFDYVPAAWACMIARVGFLPWSYRAVAAQPGQVESKLAFITSKLEQSWLLTTRAVLSQLPEQASTQFAGTIILEDIWESATPERLDAVLEEALHAGERRDCDAGILVQTSGSSGTPKLVEISFEKVLNRWQQEHNDSGDDAYLALQPFDTSFASTFLLFAKPRGLHYVPLERAFADPQSTLAFVARHGIDHLGSSNSFFGKVLEALEGVDQVEDLASLVSIRFSGELASHSLALAVRDRLRAVGADPALEVRLMYGSSEVGHISMISDGDLSKRPDLLVSDVVSQGHVRPGNELRVVDEHSNVLGHHQIGLIQVRTDFQMFDGYYGDADSTNEALTADGWFQSGDLGFVDPLGITVVGRESGMIIVNGRNISLSQIDAALHRVDGVAGQKVAAVAMRSATDVTEALIVLVVPTRAARQDHGSLERTIRRKVAQSFGVSVAHVLAIDDGDFARTPTGKVDRPSLQEVAEQLLEARPQAFGQQSRSSGIESDGTPAQVINAIWAQTLGPDAAADPTAEFFDMGGDSLSFAAMIVSIEDRFNCEVPIQQFFKQPVLATLVELVEAHRSSAVGTRSETSETTRRVLRGVESALATWPGFRRTPDSLLVGANVTGSRPPIIWVCQSLGEWNRLSLALGPDQPVYGLRSLDQFMPIDDITTEALDTVSYRYVAEILAHRFEQPPVIGGNCSGAAVALSAARKLRHFNVDHRAVILLNWMFSFGRYDGPVTLVQGLKDVAPFALHDFYGTPLDWQKDFPNATTRVIPGGHGQYFSGSSLQALAAELLAATEAEDADAPA